MTPAESALLRVLEVALQQVQGTPVEHATWRTLAQGVISNITSAESVAVVALFAVGGIRALATQVSLLAASVADGCRTAFPPALPEPLEGAEPDDIPGLGCPFMPFAAGPEGGFRLAAGFLPEPLPVPVPFALLPALP